MRQKQLNTQSVASNPLRIGFRAAVTVINKMYQQNTEQCFCGIYYSLYVLSLYGMEINKLNKLTCTLYE